MKKEKNLIAPLVSAAILFGMALLLSGCGAASKKSTGEKTHVVLNEVAHSIFYSPLYVAIEEGYFAKEGLDVELVTGYGADKTMTALLSDEADIGFMGAEATIYSYAEGIDDPAINFAQLTQRAGNFLVARERIDNFSWDMLKGKDVIGGRAGGMPEMVFEYILSKNNIAKSEVNIDQSIDFGSTAAAFSGGQGDFTVEFEPHATSLELKGDGYVVASLGEASGYVPYTSFSAKKSYLEKNPETIRAFVNALKKGMDYCASHDAKEIAKVIAPQFAETEAETLEIIVGRYAAQDTWKKDPTFEKDAFDLLQNILIDAGELDKAVPYEELVTTKFTK